MSICFAQAVQMSFLCWMKLILVSLLLVIISLSSCKSEYEQRLEEARVLKKSMALVEANSSIYEEHEFLNKKELIEEEIRFLAKVSGNEKLFLKEIYED